MLDYKMLERLTEADSAAIQREFHVDCTCDIGGSYCQCHGEYTPAVLDLEVLEMLYENRQSQKRQRSCRLS